MSEANHPESGTLGSVLAPPCSSNMSNKIKTRYCSLVPQKPKNI